MIGNDDRHRRGHGREQLHEKQPDTDGRPDCPTPLHKWPTRLSDVKLTAFASPSDVVALGHSYPANRCSGSVPQPDLSADPRFPQCRLRAGERVELDQYPSVSDVERAGSTRSPPQPRRQS